MTFLDAIRTRILGILRDRDMTAYRLSKDGGIPKATLSVLLNGKTKTMEIDTLYQVVATLAMSLKDFFDDPIFDDITD